MSRRGKKDQDALSERRASGRIRELSKRVKIVDTETREELRQSARSARLEALESDNYQEEVNNDDDEYVDLVDDEDDFMGPKKKRPRKTAREMFKQPKKKKFAFPSFNTVLDESGLEAYPAHVPTYLTAAAAPSKFPTKNFCSVCGFFANYSCTQCGARFCCIKCNATHKETRCLKFVA
eukprot:Phypoly_transcript_21021.p1 GENE.Phypoly_transcript_21021~~Phypoly_transcript_21021.p1  ORF type:complete len:194 (+),score=24.69 Phypoly_transcript_21021:48-584(+)